LKLCDCDDCDEFTVIQLTQGQTIILLLNTAEVLTKSLLVLFNNFLECPIKYIFYNLKRFSRISNSSWVQSHWD